MFKKVLVFLLSSFVVISLFVFNNSPLFTNYADEYEVYLTDFSCSSKIIGVSKARFPFILNVKGESVQLKKESFDLENFLKDLNAEIVMIESVENYDCYYAYSPDIKRSKIVYDKTVNLHIAIGNNSVKVGSPLIYGSF